MWFIHYNILYSLYFLCQLIRKKPYFIHIHFIKLVKHSRCSRIKFFFHSFIHWWWKISTSEQKKWFICGNKISIEAYLIHSTSCCSVCSWGGKNNINDSNGSEPLVRNYKNSVICSIRTFEFSTENGFVVEHYSHTIPNIKWNFQFTPTAFSPTNTSMVLRRINIGCWLILLLPFFLSPFITHYTNCILYLVYSIYFVYFFSILS